MPHDTDIDPDLDCPHMVIEFAPFECEHGDLHDTWECQDCGVEFLPMEEAASWHGAALELREALVALGQEHRRLRIRAAAGVVFTLGLLIGRR